MAADPAHLATIWRGGVPEAVVRGHVALAAADGSAMSHVGDADALTTLRSCVKPIQALPFVERAMDAIGADGSELAVACSSHAGGEIHLRAVRELLRRANVPETALRCGPQMPRDPSSARRLLASGGEPLPIHNNCSGKHAAMLATCAVEAWPLDGYLEPDHPCQQQVTAALSEKLRLDLRAAPWGIDGCGLPTYGVPLVALAGAFAAGPGDPRFRRCLDAMADHPELVSGAGRFDTVILASYGERVIGKGGGAALWAAALRDRSLGLAVKLEAGEGADTAPVALAVLQALGELPSELPAVLAPFARPVLHNWAGQHVGFTRVEHASLEALRAVL